MVDLRVRIKAIWACLLIVLLLLLQLKLVVLGLRSSHDLWARSLQSQLIRSRIQSHLRHAGILRSHHIALTFIVLLFATLQDSLPIPHVIWVLFGFDERGFEFIEVIFGYVLTFFKWNDLSHRLLGWDLLLVFLFLFFFITAQFVLVLPIATSEVVVLTTAGGAKRSTSRLLVPLSMRGTLSGFLILLIVATAWSLTLSSGVCRLFGVLPMSHAFHYGRRIRTIDLTKSILCANWKKALLIWNCMRCCTITMAMHTNLTFKRFGSANKELVTVSIFVTETLDRVVIGTENDGWLWTFNHQLNMALTGKSH